MNCSRLKKSASPFTLGLKGLCQPRRMRALMRSTLAQLFQIPLESSGSCFHLFIFGKLAGCFYLQRSLSNYRSCLLRYFWKLLQWRKAKIPRRVVCKLVSTGLYCACASADIVPLMYSDVLDSVSLYATCLWILFSSFSKAGACAESWRIRYRGAGWWRLRIWAGVCNLGSWKKQPAIDKNNVLGESESAKK